MGATSATQSSMLAQPPRPVLPPLGGGQEGRPLPLTALVGRERELALVHSLIRRSDIRLLTLTGPGGIGKTRLALQLVVDLADDFADGVRFVPLAAVRDAELVAASIAHAIGVQPSGGGPVRDDLMSALQGSDLLLVIDNFEHVLAAASVLTDLLASCPRLKIITTSRVLLRVDAEHALAVPPLTVPDPHSVSFLGDLFQSSAIQLFVDRAKAVEVSFHLTETTAPQIAEICRRVDGLPLAIELVAPRVRHLALPDLLDRLDRRLPLLTGGPRDQPSRLQTMRNAIAWSHDVLTPDEQAIFRRIAVFTGGFTLAAAEAIAGGQGWRPEGDTAGAVWGTALRAEGERDGDGEASRRADEKEDHPSPTGPQPRPPQGVSPVPHSAAALSPSVFDGLATLIDASLLQTESRTNGTTRYRMLETIREFAGEHLAASGEEDAVRERHADWCLALAEGFGAGAAFGVREDLWWQRLAEADHDNMRAALAWLESAGNAPGMLRLAVAIQPLWEVRGDHAEAIGWFERALALGGEVPPRLRLAALEGLGRHLERQGHYDRARSRFEEALSLSRELGEPRAIARALYALGAVATNQGHYDEAAPLFEESLTVFQRLGDTVEIGGSHYFLGIIAYGRGDFTAAVAHLEAALEAQGGLGALFNRGIFLTALGLLHCELGDAASGAAALAESAAILRPGEETNREVVAEWLAAVARLAVCLRRTEQAARLYGTAEAWTEAAGSPLVVPPRGQYLRVVEGLRHDLGSKSFAAAWSAGRTLPLEQAIQEAHWLTDRPADDEEPIPTDSTATALLTPRELEVLALLAGGLTDPEISAALFISVRTVENHVAHVLTKLGVRTRTAAASAAFSAGVGPPDSPQPPNP